MNERSERVWRRWRIALALSVAALFGVLASHRLHDNDLYWHLAFGRAFAETRRLVVPEPLTLPEFGANVLVHQWPWDFVLYTVQSAFGFRGVGILVVALATLAGIGLALLATNWNSTRPRTMNVLAAVLVTAPLVVTRLNERPETVTAIFWPFGLLLARSLAEPEARNARSGARASNATAAVVRVILLVLLTVVWAQTHLSMLVFLAATYIVLAPGCLPGSGPGRGARIGALAGMTVAAICNPFAITSAKGYHLFAVVQHPVAGFINEHIAEWKPLEWRMLDPTDPQNLQGPAYAVLLLVSVVGVVRFGRRRLTEVALALLGVLVIARGRRGIFAAGFLTLPLVVATLEHAFGSLALRARALRVVAAFGGLFFVVRSAQWIEENDGPLLRLGLEEGAFPTSAARWLATDPAEHRALTTYRTGPILAFATHGRVRGYVDSRAPAVFSEAHLAAALTLWQDPRALPATLARYRFDVAVVERRFSVCDALAASPDWSAVLVEPAFTTFVRSAGATVAPLRRLLPCGTAYLDEERSCGSLPELDAELDRTAPLVTPSFARHLRADRIIRCSKGRFDGDAVRAMIPPAGDASGFEPARDALLAWLLALGGQPGAAVALLEPRVKAGDDWVIADALPALVATGPRGGAAPEVRALLDLVATHADQTSDGLVLALAAACARSGDSAGALLHASRAAVVGLPGSVPALCYVQTAGTPDERREADAWLAALRERGVPAGCDR